MSKCPSCGYEQLYTTTNEGRRFRDIVSARLVEYGYPERMNPKKHYAYEVIRKAIQIRFGLNFKAGGSMTNDTANKAIALLDEILPRKQEGGQL